MVLSQAEKYENRLKKQIEEYEIKDKAQRKQDRLLNDRNNLMNERERENRMKGNYELKKPSYELKRTLMRVVIGAIV